METRKEGMAQQGMEEREKIRKMLRQMNKGKISREEYAEEKGKIIKFGARKKETRKGKGDKDQDRSRSMEVHKQVQEEEGEDRGKNRT